GSTAEGAWVRGRAAGPPLTGQGSQPGGGSATPAKERCERADHMAKAEALSVADHRPKRAGSALRLSGNPTSTTHPHRRLGQPRTPHRTDDPHFLLHLTCRSLGRCLSVLDVPAGHLQVVLVGRNHHHHPPRPSKNRAPATTRGGTKEAVGSETMPRHQPPPPYVPALVATARCRRCARWVSPGSPCMSPPPSSPAPSVEEESAGDRPGVDEGSSGIRVHAQTPTTAPGRTGVGSKAGGSSHPPQ